MSTETITLRRTRRAVSLVELLAVIVILGILAALIVPRITTSSSTTNTNACDVNKGNIEIQVQLFYRNEGHWPQNDLSDMLPTSTTPKYNYFPGGLPVCPVDGSDYQIDPVTHEVVGHTH